MVFKFLGLLIVCVLSVGVPASAHHSHNAYEVTKWSPLEGVVKEIHWVVPHSWVYIDVKDKGGATEQWTLETLPPATLRKGGLRSDMLGKGEAVTVLAYRARSDAKLAFLRKITFADGREVVVWVGDIKTAK